MFSFPPKTNEEIQEIINRGLLKEDVYPFTVTKAQIGCSKAGNMMIELHLKITHDGEERNLKDYLVSTDNMVYKIKHFCEAVGLNEKYLAGAFDLKDCEGKTGWCLIGVQKGSAKPDGSGFYADRNCVKDYVEPMIGAAAAKASPPISKVLNEGVDADFDDKEIPF